MNHIAEQNNRISLLEARLANALLRIETLEGSVRELKRMMAGLEFTGVKYTSPDWDVNISTIDVSGEVWDQMKEEL